MRLCLTVIVAAPFAPDIARGQRSGEKTYIDRDERFTRLDTDGDGFLAAEEYADGAMGKMRSIKEADHAARDQDGDGKLTYEEFTTWPKKERSREEIEQAFTNLDKDENAYISLEEFVGNRQGKDLANRRRGFYGRDRDGDERISKPEFLGDMKHIPLAPASVFRQRDDDADGKLSREEFMRPVKDKSWADAARRNFRKYDLNEDDALQLSEFQLLPSQSPSAGRTFGVLDRNDDKQLKYGEFSAVNPNVSRKNFISFDSDGDDALSRSEFIQREETIQSRQFWGAFKKHASTWGIRLLVVVDIGLVCGVAWIVRKRWVAKHA